MIKLYEVVLQNGHTFTREGENIYAVLAVIPAEVVIREYRRIG